MRTILGWAIKLSIGGLIYVGMTQGTSIKLPETVMGFKVPPAAQEFVNRNAQIADFGHQAQAGFRGISDALK